MLRHDAVRETDVIVRGALVTTVDWRSS